VWPAHAIATFDFQAAKGANTLTLETEQPTGTPLRIAGLVIAPATPEGRAFVAAHDRLQRDAVAKTFAPLDKGRRDHGRVQPGQTLVIDPLPVGEQMYPRDWPLHAQGAPVPAQTAVTGQTVAVQLGLFATKPMAVTIAAEALTGPAGAIADPRISHGRYLPTRPYDNGMEWLEINHYRPEPTCTVGPELARSVIVEYRVPGDAKGGAYAGVITVTAAGEAPVRVPISLQVVAVPLAELPIPVTVMMNSLPFGPQDLDETTWWRLQEDVAREQMRAGLTALSGGPGVAYAIDAAGAVSGDAAVRYVKMAQRYGTVRAVIPYGGFLPSMSEMTGDFTAIARGLAAFEQANQLPPTFVYAFDEPTTEAEYAKVLAALERATAAGLRTIGYTSVHANSPNWDKLIAGSYAPALNIHGADDLAKMRAAGKHVFVYNNGLDRYSFGLHLWRGIALGAEGRMNWIGMYTQGFAFYNLDGREPSMGCFLVHDRLGVLPTPNWLSTREGLLDARLRLTLEKYAPKGDPALDLWKTEGYKTDKERWTTAELDRARAGMLARIGELMKGK
jgi:hypothetical protein